MSSKDRIHFCQHCRKEFVGAECPYCGWEWLSLPSSSYYSKPSALWWLVPFSFGVIGGILAYVATKQDDPYMADDLLWFGIIWPIRPQ